MSRRHDPDVARTRACAVGMAFARRADDDSVDDLVGIAGARVWVLRAARSQLLTLDGVDGPTRARAAALLDAAARRLRRGSRPGHDGDATAEDSDTDELDAIV